MIKVRFLAILIPLILVSPPASADTISFGGGVIDQRQVLTAHTTVTGGSLNLEDFDTTTFVFPGDRTAAEAVIEAPRFASALTDANGNLEVGVRALRAGSTSSDSLFELLMINDSPTPMVLAFSFTIPAGSILLTDFSTPLFSPPDGPRAGVLADIEYSIGGAVFQPIFEFGAQMQVNGGVAALTPPIGPALLTSSKPSSSHYRVDIAEHSETILFPIVPPGEDIHVRYAMNAFGFLGDSPIFGVNEFGYEAFLGDPLNVLAGGSVHVAVNPATAAEGVPEPASFLLCGLGLIALAGIRLRK